MVHNVGDRLMLLRRLLLVLGTLALLAGIALTGVWLSRPSTKAVESAQVAQQSVLVAARPLPAGTLLRAVDVRWKQLPVTSIPDGSFVQGTIAEADLYGAVARRDFVAGEPLVVGQVIKPTESGFLAAVLGPGMRAVSIEVSPAAGSAGLIAPGDRVDIILTQSFEDIATGVPTRSVGETVLKNLRVVAVGQAISAADRPAGAENVMGVAAEPKLPKTVTLEVDASDAQTLLLAVQLGKVQLALRSFDTAGDSGAIASAPGPTWATDVSPALRMLTTAAARPVPVKETQPTSRAAPRMVPVSAIEVIHGTKIERRCFNKNGSVNSTCESSSAANPESAPATSP